MPIVYAASVTTPETVVGIEPRFMKWTGFDGSVWVLTGAGASNPRMRPGVKGLHMPEMVVQKSSTPLVAGVDLLGYELPERSVYWPLLFRSASVLDWEQDHAGLFDSFHPIEPGVWQVGAGDDARTVELTGDFKGDYTFTRDPFMTGLAVIGVELIAPRPLWRGKPIKKTFGGEEGVDFIPPTPGENYFPSPTATFQQAQIDNPGNEPAYLTYTAVGPLPDLTMGVGEAVIDVPFAVNAGSTLVVNTDPAGQFATLDGVDCTRELGFQVFAPVPPRGTTSLAIAASGSGTVTAELTPLYWRAF